MYACLRCIDYPLKGKIRSPTPALSSTPSVHTHTLRSPDNPNIRSPEGFGGRIDRNTPEMILTLEQWQRAGKIRSCFIRFGQTVGDTLAKRNHTVVWRENCGVEHCDALTSSCLAMLLRCTYCIESLFIFWRTLTKPPLHLCATGVTSHAIWWVATRSQYTW